MTIVNIASIIVHHFYRMRLYYQGLLQRHDFKLIGTENSKILLCLALDYPCRVSS